jgi:hypothetical protein
MNEKSSVRLVGRWFNEHLSCSKVAKNLHNFHFKNRGVCGGVIVRL